MNENREIHRGDIYWVKVMYSDGSGSKIRPGIIVSNDYTNVSAPDVTIVPVTKMANRPDLRTNVPMLGACGLALSSYAKCSDLIVVPKTFLYGWIGHLDAADMAYIDQAMALSLGLAGSDGINVRKDIKLGNELKELDAYRVVVRDLISA